MRDISDFDASMCDIGSGIEVVMAIGACVIDDNDCLATHKETQDVTINETRN